MGISRGHKVTSSQLVNLMADNGGSIRDTGYRLQGDKVVEGKESL